MVLLLKQWKSRSSPGFATGASKNPFSMLKMPLPGLPRSGLFVWHSGDAGWSGPPPSRFAERQQKELQAAVRGGRKLGDAGWSSPVARQAHNLKVAGSNPAPATTITDSRPRAAFLLSGSVIIGPFAMVGDVEPLALRIARVP
jgi:hypothetical protein